MTRGEVKQIVGASLLGMKAIMGLGLWDITIHYRKIKDSRHNKLMGFWSMANCKTQTGRGDWHEKAVITIDCDKIFHPADLTIVLWHELAHAKISEYFLRMRNSVCDLLCRPDFAHRYKNAREVANHINAADEGLAQAIQKIAGNFLYDKEEQAARCLKHGCSTEATADICGVSLNFVRQIAARQNRVTLTA